MSSLADELLDDLDAGLPSEDAGASSATAAAAEEDVEMRDVSSTPTESPSLFPALTSRLSSLLARARHYEQTPVSESEVSSTSVRPEDNAEYLFVVECVEIFSELDTAISDLHALLREVYKLRFPELETLILNPLDYARIVQRAGNVSDFARIDLKDILPSGAVITVQVTASATAGRILTPSEFNRASTLARELLEIDEAKGILLSYVESRAVFLAPNLTAVVGGAVAATLMGLAGGLSALAQTPSCNVKVMGKRLRSRHAGTDAPSQSPHQGVVYTCALVSSLPPRLRARAGDAVAGKATLAARVDAHGGSRDGSVGRAFADKLKEKFEKWAEPPPAKTAVPLPIPGEEKRTHRGGKRARKEKERLGITDARKMRNRMKFGEMEVIHGNDLEAEGMGMLGMEGGGVRITKRKTDSLSVAAKRRLAKQKKKDQKSTKAVSGLGSTLAFSEGDGIELGVVVPAPGGVGLGDVKKHNDEQSNYFSSATPFVGIKSETGDGQNGMGD